MGASQNAAFLQARAKGRIGEKWKRAENYLSTNEWEGEDVWILGGGPSLKDQRIADLPGRVFAVNMAYKLRPFDLWFIGSISLINLLSRRGVDLSRTYSILSGTYQMSGGVRDLRSFNVCNEPWGTTVAGGIPLSYSSGCHAINIADILGAKTIYLLGFDMMGAEDGRTANWHAEYPTRMRPPSSHYDKYLEELEHRAKPNVNARVVNCTPNSALTCFETKDFLECSKS